MTDRGSDGARRGFFRSVGPALIVAAVVLGPGSILTNSRVGAEFGYDFLWLLVVATVLMIGFVALASCVGVQLDGTPCDELARRIGRPFAALVGVTMFLIIVCFQATNDLGVLAGVEALLGDAESSRLEAPGVRVVVLVTLNGVVVAALAGWRRLYGGLERMMTILVALMIVGFFANLAFAAPRGADVLSGLVPSLPAGVDTFLPRRVGGALHDPLLPVQALVGTTFSVAGAFYHAYLVREKGWTRHPGQLRRGLVDALSGIAVLGAISAAIMLTSAAVLHADGNAPELASAADVARQLEPLFGAGARLLFGVGLFAGAFSSFLVNALIGGTLLADGFGLGGRMDDAWPRRLTVLALAGGMVIALVGAATGRSLVDLIVFAHALSVFAVPVLALSLLWLASRPDVRARVPRVLLAGAGIGTLLVVALSIRTAWRLFVA